MNTLLIIADCCKTATHLTPPPIKQGANDCNVLITAIICLSLVVLALIVAITISRWHKKELESKTDSKNENSSGPSQQEKDKKEYTSKLISFMEELAKKDSKMKEANDSACKDYIALLKKLAQIEPTKQQ